jgi:acyl-CoA dehydrogenase
VLHDVIDRAVQAHGSLGYSTDLPLEQMYRLARSARIYDGPDEVHRVTVARRALKNYEASSGPYPTEHIPTRREAAQKRFAELLDEVGSNL